MPDWLTERTILLSLHVGTAILFLGPVTVAASMFPRYAAEGNLPVARALNRVTRIYGILSILVAVFGIILAARIDVFDQPWVSWSLGLFILAAVIQVGLVERGQDRFLKAIEAERAGRQGLTLLRVASGLFTLIWVVILVLMIGKPG